MNAPIQGTSADMIKIAMINIHEWLSTSSLRTTMLMQVHDELIFDVPENELKEVEATVREMMEQAQEQQKYQQEQLKKQQGKRK